jgi:Fe-S-cluster containining protein
VKTEYAKYLTNAIQENELLKKTFQRLKSKKNKEVDDLFHQLHTKAFQKTDCLACANCCKTTSPIFRDVDIKRIAKHLRLKENQFIQSYLKMDEENDYVLQSSPCSFLDDDNTCSIYEFRPLACREYPHTDRKNMFQILDLTLRNTLVCPAVAKISLEIASKTH